MIIAERSGENTIQAEASQRTEQRESNSPSRLGTAQERLPTPTSLAEVITSSIQFINEQVAECLQVCCLMPAYLLYCHCFYFSLTYF